MDSVTKHKCSNNVERESNATKQKHRHQKLRSWDQVWGGMVAMLTARNT